MPKPKLRSSVQKLLAQTIDVEADRNAWLMRNALVCQRYAKAMLKGTFKLWIYTLRQQEVAIQPNYNRLSMTFTIRGDFRFLDFFFHFARRVRIVDLDVRNCRELNADLCRFAVKLSKLLQNQPRLKKLNAVFKGETGVPFLSLLPDRITTLSCTMRELPACRVRRPLDCFVCDDYDRSCALYYALRVPARRVRMWQWGDEGCKLRYFAGVGDLPPNPHLKHLQTYVDLVPEGIRLLGQREDGNAERLATWRRALECFKRVNPHMSLSFHRILINIRGIRQLATFRTRLRLIQERAQELVNLAVDEERKCSRFRAQIEATVERERRWREGSDFYRGTAMRWYLRCRTPHWTPMEYDEEAPADWQDEWDEGRQCVGERMVEHFGSFLEWTAD
ncbi:hypothetical protein M3Y99_01436500 [Aphelenchoides fujianensis]|nr:hypothetical protein M3Y99_01436500 [Aphelenchoides fujianensis]